MSIREAVICTATLVTLCVCVSAAQANPEELAERYLSSLARGDYVQAAAMFDPQELGEIRSLLSFFYESTEDSQEQLLKTFFGATATPDLVADLSDAEFFAAILQLTMEQAKKSAGLNFGDIRTLGYVAEPPDLAHVIARFDVTFGAEPISMLDLVSMRRIGDEWKLLMQADVKALARELQARFDSVE